MTGGQLAWAEEPQGGSVEALPAGGPQWGRGRGAPWTDPTAAS